MLFTRCYVFVFVLSTFFVATGSISVYAAANYTIKNSFSRSPIRVFVYGYESKRWASSKKPLALGEAWNVKLRGGIYELQIIDREGNKRSAGRHDFGRKGGMVEIGLSNSFMRWDEQSKKYVMVITTPTKMTVDSNGQLRAGGASTGSLVLRGAKYVGSESNAPQSPSSKNTLGIRMKKCDQGIHIVSVTPGSPATRLLSPDKKTTFALEPGDHIIRVNQVAPRSKEHMIQLIQSAGDSARIDASSQRGFSFSATAYFR